MPVVPIAGKVVCSWCGVWVAEEDAYPAKHLIQVFFGDNLESRNNLDLMFCKAQHRLNYFYEP